MVACKPHWGTMCNIHRATAMTALDHITVGWWSSIQNGKSIKNVLVLEVRETSSWSKNITRCILKILLFKIPSCSINSLLFPRTASLLPASHRLRRVAFPSACSFHLPAALVTAVVGFQALQFQWPCPVSEGTAPSCTTEHQHVESVCTP